MNKKLIAVAIGAALSGSAFAQSSNVTLYGRIHQSVESLQAGTASSEHGIREVGSRLGVRGVEDLGGGLKGVFGFEAGVNADEVNGGGADGARGALGNTRNAYVGLDTGSTGRIVIGVLDGAVNAPLYSQIFKGITDINHDGGTAQFAAGRNDTLRGNQRLGDAIGYNVTVSGVEIASRLAFQTASATGNGGRSFVNNPPAGTPNGEQGGRNFSIAATTKVAGIDLGAGYEREDYTLQADEIGSFKNRFQLVGGYKVGDLKIGGIVARNAFEAGGNGVTNAKDTETEYGFSLAYDLNPKSQAILNYFNRDNAPTAAALSRSTVGAGPAVTADSDRRQLQAGYKYNFSRRTMAYAMYQRLDRDSKVSDDEQKAIIVGVRHNF